MDTVSWDLRELTDNLVEEVRKRLRAVSIEQYQLACNGLVRHAKESGATEWSPGLAAGYREHIDGRMAEGEMCPEYHRFQRRVLRMLESLAMTGEVDFAAAPSGAPAKYPVSDELADMVERILDARRISDRT